MGERGLLALDESLEDVIYYVTSEFDLTTAEVVGVLMGKVAELSAGGVFDAVDADRDGGDPESHADGEWWEGLAECGVCHYKGIAGWPSSLNNGEVGFECPRCGVDALKAVRGHKDNDADDDNDDDDSKVSIANTPPRTSSGLVSRTMFLASDGDGDDDARRRWVCRCRACDCVVASPDMTPLAGRGLKCPECGGYTLFLVDDDEEDKGDSMKYTLCAADTIEGLDAVVNDALAEGWTLLGGVSIAQSESDEYDLRITYAQAMVSYDSSDDRAPRSSAR